MKKSLREKFKNSNFVKPLYKKVKFNRDRPIKSVCIAVDVSDVDDNNPCGHGINVKRKIVKDKSVNYNIIAIKSDTECDRTLPGVCEIPSFKKIYTKTLVEHQKHEYKNRPKEKYNLLGIGDKVMEDRDADSKSVQAVNSAIITQKVPDTWLRVYPASQSPGEPTMSVIFRCLLSQLGLATFLVLWTLVWVFIIQYFEGPYEMKVSLQFEKQQNQLVIDLATELRQITPLSPKWKHAIERRIEDERLLTMTAVAQGAKLHPGQFWDLSGTFLFTVYVMTALGFGAPVPNTVWGRTCALIYAALSVPTHIYLMVNASTCIVAKMEAKIKSCRKRSKNTRPNETSSGNTESTDQSRNSEPIKTTRGSNLRRRLLGALKILTVGRCIPLACMIYFAVGAVSFGVLRRRHPLQIVMFPLEFTTTGGLEHVESYVRILYGLYIEGAMSLLACSLATLRRHSSDAVSYMSDKYRLFTIHTR